LKKKNQRAKVVVYHHPHHIEKQQSSRQGHVSINKLIMDQHGTRKETNQEAHGGITTMHGDIKIEQQSHGTKGVIRIKIKVARTKLDIMFIFH
jgi:hypothetical protein